jgi:hypothetical protein
MIRLCREAGIRLIFVRVPVNLFSDPASRPGGLDQYSADLSGYLAGQQVSLIDLHRAQGIGPAHFLDYYHMNPRGNAIFTKILAGALENLLQ